MTPRPVAAIVGMGDAYASRANRKDPLQLAAEATLNALADAGIRKDQVDAVFTGRSPWADKRSQWSNIFISHMQMPVTLTSEPVEVPADPRAQFDLSFAERWGDGYPLLPPTEDAVQALLDASPYPADYALCVLPPVNGVATVELISINAAMAGVEPAAFPYVLAALEAL